MADTHLNPRGEDPGGRLPDPLSAVLHDPVDEPGVARMWRRIEERRLRPEMPVRTVFVWALAGAALSIVLTTGFLLSEKSPAAEKSIATAAGPLALRSGGPVPRLEVRPDVPPTSLDLADGSRVILEAGTAFEPLVSSDREFIVRLGKGRASFDVQPGGPRRWVVEAGLASVEVIGTRFSVARRPNSVRVEVDRGSVLVRGSTVPDGVARLAAGASIDVVEKAEVAAPDRPSRSDVRTASPPRKAEAWRERAARGNYREAYVALGAEGLLREVRQASSAEDLFALADVARLSGHPGEAIAPLETLVTGYSSNPRAAIAALTLGRIELDLGHARRASQALERALGLGAPSGLEEDVYARLVEAHTRAGDVAEARARANEYRRRFPNGRRLPDVDRWVAP